MKSYEDTCELCLKKMFAAVGEQYPNKEITDKKDWWMLRRWSEKEEDDFVLWMRKLLKKRHRWNKVIIDREISMFLLQLSWSYAKKDS
jgi:hypothetical protein